jgi:hypothetical protein
MSQKPRSQNAQQIAAENLERMKAARPLRPPVSRFVERVSTAGAQELRTYLLRAGRVSRG